MLKIESLTCTLGKSRILNGVTFSLSQGETVGVIGPNGSGKTTLFNCISGFAAVDGGSIVFKTEDVKHLYPNERARRGIGRIFQNFGIFREMTVLENVLTALESRQSALKTLWPWGSTTAANKVRAREYLSQVKLEGKAALRASSLSGGQMRLLEIVRALAFGADLFLLDEPTAGVSPKMKEDVSGLIERLRELGKTVLIIEHDINFIQKFCERIIVLDSGKVVLDDTPEKVRTSPLLHEIYFGKSEARRAESARA